MVYSNLSCLLWGTSGLKISAWAVCKSTARSELTHSDVVWRVSHGLKLGASALSGEDGSVRDAAALELGRSIRQVEELVDCVCPTDAALTSSASRKHMLMWCLPPHFRHLARL